MFRRGRSAWMRQPPLFAVLASAAVVLSGVARADDAPPSISANPQFSELAPLKKGLADKGITLQATYIGESLADISGGARQGAIYDGRLELMLEADMAKIAGWQGATLHADGFWIQGTGLTRYYVGSLEAVSYIEALPTVRLYELWWEQKLADNKLALRAGLLGADSDFVASKYAQLFVNATTGWPEIFSSDMPSSGPAYPFSAMGFRARFDATDNFALVAAIYDGDPAGPGAGDPQRRNPYGLAFRMSDPPLMMQEAQFKYFQDKNSAGLPGTIKLGAWEYFGDVADYNFDPMGVQYNLTGLQPVGLLGDHGFYAMIDQLLMKAPDDPTKGIGVFARVFGAPSDRNLIEFYCDAGVNVSGLVPGRSDDVFGFSVAYTKISSSVVDAAYAANLSVTPYREALLELTYQAQIMTGWTLQPVAQYVIEPGAGLGGTKLPNAVVVGLRTTIAY